MAQFGPEVPDDAPEDMLAGVSARYRAVEVYQVAGAQAAQPLSSQPRVRCACWGAPESLITLANAGLLGNQPGAPQQ